MVSEGHSLALNFQLSDSQVTETSLQTDTRTDGWIGKLDRSTINNAFSFSHYYTTHFTGHSTIKVNPPFSLFVQSISIRSIWDAS